MVIPFHGYAKDYNEQSLRSLFTSQQQRQEIDNNRNAAGSKNEPANIRPSSVHINGIVKRSNGKSVVWINGKNTLDNSIVDGVKIYSNGITEKNKIPVSVDDRTIYIKPGETWSEETGVSGVGE